MPNNQLTNHQFTNSLTNKDLSMSTRIEHRVSSIDYQASKTCKSCQNIPLHLSRTLYKSALFMQNKPNLQNDEMNVSAYITDGYDNFLPSSRPKNKAKQTQNKPNFSPKLALNRKEIVAFWHSLHIKYGRVERGGQARLQRNKKRKKS